MVAFDIPPGVVTVITAALAVIAVAIPAWLNARGARREARAARASAVRVETAVGTGNGKPIGPTTEDISSGVHRIEGAMELMRAQLHTNTREVVGVSNQLAEHLEEAKRAFAKLDEHAETLDQHLEDVRVEHARFTPMQEFVEDLMQRDVAARKGEIDRREPDTS